MNKNSVIQAEIALNITLHGTPITGMDTVNLSSSCKHTTQLACQFKALSTVTQLHLRGAYEN